MARAVKKPEAAAPAEIGLVTFLPAETFTGYPDGRTAVLFKAGVESPPVTAAFAQLMRDKGHVAPRTHLHTPTTEDITE